MSKTPADKSIDEQTFEALEDALKIDLDDDGLGALDDISIEELENKVSHAVVGMGCHCAARRGQAGCVRNQTQSSGRKHRTPRADPAVYARGSTGAGQ